ncbi:PHP domain-containing protein, partial [Candidatus Woesearchaeota archaeon]
MKNQKIARMFREIADVYAMRGVEWKPQAYRRAARAIESLGTPIEQVYAQGGRSALEDIPGIGKSFSEKIEEFLKTGKMRAYERMIKGMPKGFEKLMDVPGLGPKKVLRLQKELGINNLKDLKKAIISHKICALQGFGEKSEKDILRGLRLLEKGSERKLLGFVLPLARNVKSFLERVDGVERVELAGSIRRMKKTVGDVDILVISSKPKKVIDAFASMPDVSSILAKGNTKCTVVLEGGLQMDLRVLERKSFGSALLYFTGSKDHNVAVRKIAIEKGFKLSEYGLFKNGKFVCGKDEKQIYRKLGLEWIPPELRENTGEIEAASRGALPKLVELSDIKGDLQVHTKWSDGAHSIEVMARTAQDLGYKYVAITDHSKSERIAHGMDEARLKKYISAIENAQKKVDIEILKGAEVDILPDGSLDFSNKVLGELDVVVASVHSRFKSSRKEMTKRVLSAFDNE